MINPKIKHGKLRELDNPKQTTWLALPLTSCYSKILHVHIHELIPNERGVRLNRRFLEIPRLGNRDANNAYYE